MARRASGAGTCVADANLRLALCERALTAASPLWRSTRALLARALGQPTCDRHIGAFKRRAEAVGNDELATPVTPADRGHSLRSHAATAAAAPVAVAPAQRQVGARRLASSTAPQGSPASAVIVAGVPIAAAAQRAQLARPGAAAAAAPAPTAGHAVAAEPGLPSFWARRTWRGLSWRSDADANR